MYRSVYVISQISAIFYLKSSFLQAIYKKIMTILAYNVHILCVVLTIIQYAYIFKQFAILSYFFSNFSPEYDKYTNEFYTF